MKASLKTISTLIAAAFNVILVLGTLRRILSPVDPRTYSKSHTLLQFKD